MGPCRILRSADRLKMITHYYNGYLCRLQQQKITILLCFAFFSSGKGGVKGILRASRVLFERQKGLLHSPRKGDLSSQFGIVASLR